MANHYKVGELRPSQIMFSFGIGSIVDLPNLSVMVMGLDEWDTTQTNTLAEERLLAAVQDKVGKQVRELRSPPMPPPEFDRLSSTPFDQTHQIGIPTSPFPGWGVCPQCRMLARFDNQLFRLKENIYHPDRTQYVHENCQYARGGRSPVVVPARFLVACTQGHLDDFPWRYFVHRGATDCQGALRLLEVGVSGSAADVVVRCEGCQRNRSMADAFGSLGTQNMPQCRGRHPHLRSFDEDGCEEQMKAILLGASNSWFPMTLSVLSVPGSVNELDQPVEQEWATLKEVSDESQLSLLRRIGQLKLFSKYSDAEVWATVQQYGGTEDQPEPEDQNLKLPEWLVFSNADPNLDTDSFRLNPVAPPTGYEDYFVQTVLVERLREVRALVGFTRIEFPGELSESVLSQNVPVAPLCANSRPTWIPATETRGEGIFLQVKEEAIAHWIDSHPDLADYERQTHQAHTRWRRVRKIDDPAENFPGLRYLLLHSLAHALMRQLAIECGYAAASLRERIYSSRADEDEAMAGVLIYTASPDSEGTLGGLVSLGQPQTLGRQINQALEQISLCASDPLCADHEPDSKLHWAACHACLFSPETSCERGNKYLDRNLLVPTIKADPLDIAFFPANP